MTQSMDSDSGSEHCGHEPDHRRMVCVGVISGVHGVKGHVRIKSFTTQPVDIARYGPVYDAEAGAPLRLTVTGRSRQLLIARIDGIGDRDTAQALQGHRLFVPREAFPPLEAEEFYHADLIGLRADLATGPEQPRQTLGTVVAVHDFGGGDVLEIAGEEGGSMMVSFTKEAVPEVNVAEGWLIIVPLPGLLDAGSAAEDDNAAGDGERFPA